MVAVPCPAWEYDNPGARQTLALRVQQVLVELRVGTVDTASLAGDTRPVHERLFRGLTPPGFEYYAGHYRGERYVCLVQRDVGIRGDPRVGYPAAGVSRALGELAQTISAGLVVLDGMHGAAVGDRASARTRLLATVVLACRAFELFLRIHPYLNGNGHAARFLLWAILSRYGYWPGRFPIEPRPQDPPYSDLIIQYRNGKREPLEQFVLHSLAAW